MKNMSTEDLKARWYILADEVREMEQEISMMNDELDEIEATLIWRGETI